MKYKAVTFCILLLLANIYSVQVLAQATEIKGKVINTKGESLPFATISVAQTGITTISKYNGNFSITATHNTKELSITVSHVGKESVTRNISAAQFSALQTFVLKDLNLKLKEVEITGVHKTTASSNSSVIFNREAIEQSQALSIANVLSYLPGQTILKPGVSVQGLQNLTLRSAFDPFSEQSLNNAFGVSFVMDGSVISNDANMQAMNPGRLGLFSANNIQNPENGVIKDRSWRNGSMYNSYRDVISANNGIDMRQIAAENIESIEVISGVASARYGDYTTGIVNINRQAGITPWRINLRSNEGSINAGLNKGLRLPHKWGALNASFDYLHSNDDPRNKLKAYQRVGASLLWSYQSKSKTRFKNTLSLDYNTTLDQTRQDPDLGSDQSSKFSNNRFNISTRSQWTLQKRWINDIQFQAAYSRGRQESYEQRYLNQAAVLGITDALETGTFEGYFVPGYYLSVKHIIGEPVNASARLEANSLFKFSKSGTYRLSIGANYSYSGNKGPGILIDPSRPRFANTGNKNDRPRPFKQTPDINNAGVYIENAISTKIFGKSFNTNLGIRGDIQNNYFSVSPRLSLSYKLLNSLQWNAAYGIATKAPALSQISPGDVYIDIPLVNLYGGSVNQSAYLAYTRVITLSDLDIKPYNSNTFETGLSWDTKKISGSVYYFNRTNNDGFTTTPTLLPLRLPIYNITVVPNSKPVYEPSDDYKTYNVIYNKMSNGVYSRTNGLELSLTIKKIKSIQTSFNFNTAYYVSYNKNMQNIINIPENPQYDQKAVYGVFAGAEYKSTNIKSTITTTTHIPALRMVMIFTGEIFWINSKHNYPSNIYPAGYLDKDAGYFALTPEEARLPQYAHLIKTPEYEATTYLPSIVYPNVQMRVSKEIGDFLRFSFSAYNVFNIRPTVKTISGMAYYNGQPAYGAELVFTIK